MSVIEVSVEPGGTSGTFRVQVLRSPTGEASAVVELDAAGLASRRTELQSAVLASAVPTRRILDATEQGVREVGRALFTALLGSGEVAARYRASAAVASGHEQALRVVLRIEDPALAGLPWEAMYDDALGSYVCRRDQLVRYVPVPSSAAPLAVELPLRILGVVASPRGLAALDTDGEKAQLERALSRLSGQGLAEVHWAPSATWAELQDLLLDEHWHVIHFIGHGDFDVAQDEGVLALVGEDGGPDLVEAGRLVDLLRQARPMPRLVVLNSCAGAASGIEDLFSGTAAALVRGGVTAVAAMQYEISDAAGVAFARGFYGAIARGRGVDDAVSSGRVAIVGMNGRTLEWITPVLYFRGTDSHLFTIAERRQRAPFSKHPDESSAPAGVPANQPASAQAERLTTSEPDVSPSMGGDGLFVVGVDIEPGVYRTAGPAGDGRSGYYALLSSTSTQDVIDNGNVGGPVTIVVGPGVKAVSLAGWQPWYRLGTDLEDVINAGTEMASSMGGDGLFVVGVDIEPGVYRTAGPAGDGRSGYYALLSSTSTQDVIDNGNVAGPVTITIGPGVKAVSLAGWQPWHRHRA